MLNYGIAPIVAEAWCHDLLELAKLGTHDDQVPFETAYSIFQQYPLTNSASLKTLWRHIRKYSLISDDGGNTGVTKHLCDYLIKTNWRLQREAIMVLLTGGSTYAMWVHGLFLRYAARYYVFSNIYPAKKFSCEQVVGTIAVAMDRVWFTQRGTFAP